MTKNLTVISFYTNTWDYPKYADKLKEQCDNLGLSHKIEKLPDTGDWLNNTKMKPKFILDSLEAIKGPVLWIDVDGSLLRYPKFIVDRIDTMDFMMKLKARGQKRMFHVGTMFFNYTPQCLNFLHDWVNHCESSYASDELHLDNLWKVYKDKIKLRWCDLPIDYFFMLPALTDIPPDNTVICHRASKCKSKMNLRAQKII